MKRQLRRMGAVVGGCMQYSSTSLLYTSTSLLVTSMAHRIAIVKHDNIETYLS